jgi:hypothetical protein
VLGVGLGGEGRDVALDDLALLPDRVLLGVALLVADVLEVLDLGLGLGRQVLLDALARLLVDGVQLVAALQQLDAVGLR